MVVESEVRGPRRLPSLYVNDVQVYAGRDVGGVTRALARAVDAFVHSGERGTYMLTACEIGGRRGLYGTDFFNRSAYRRKLQRLGATFSNDPFVIFRDDGRFESEDFRAFDAEFVTLGAPSEGPAVERAAGAILLYQLAFYRIADLDEEELRRIAGVAARVVALSASDPETLVAELSA